MSNPVVASLPVTPVDSSSAGQITNVEHVSPNVKTPAPQIPSGIDQQESPPLAYDLGRYAFAARSVLRGLHRREMLVPFLREAHAEQVIQRHAAEHGLEVSAKELRDRVDDLRVRSADNSGAALKKGRLTDADQEENVRQELLRAKVRDYVTAGKVQKRFDENPSRYDRVSVRHLASVQDEWPHEFLGELTKAMRKLGSLNAQISPELRAEAGKNVIYRFQLPQPAADAIFAAPPGTVVGPIEIEPGRHFLRNDHFEPARLDAATATTIREELFEAWLDQSSIEAAVDAEMLFLL